MKALSLDMIMTSASTRSDGSLGLRFSTPELDPSEKTVVFELQNRNLKVLLQPKDEAPEALIEAKHVLDFKSPSRRLRDVMFVEFRQRKPDMLFEEYYNHEMDRIIEHRKSLLESV